MTDLSTLKDPQRMAVFLSYSRKDASFLHFLADALESRGYEPVFDRSERPGADPDLLLTAQDEWWESLTSMIAACEAMVFIVTPASAASAVCDDEIAHARALGKRVVAVLRSEIDFAVAPERLRALNVKISFCSDDETAFTAALDQLCIELDVDIDWYRRGARLMRLANQWERDGRPQGQLLRAGAITDADGWAARRPASAPEPGELLLAYLAAGRALEAADRNRLLKGVSNGFAVRADKAATENRFVHAARCVGAAAVLCDDVKFDEERALHAWRLGARALFDAAQMVAGDGLGVVSEAQWSPDGRWVAVAAEHGCQLWYPEAEELRHMLDTDGSEVRGCGFSHDGTAVVFSCTDGAVRRFDVASGRPLGHCAHHDGGANVARFIPRTLWVVSAGRDRVVRVWDIEKNCEIAEFHGHTGDILRLDVSHTGEFLASAGQDGMPRAWSVNSPGQGVVPDCRSSVVSDGRFLGISASFAPDGYSILSGSPTGEVAIWDARTGRTHLCQVCHKDAVFNPAFSPNGQLFITPGCFDYVTKVWRSADGGRVAELVGHRSSIWTAVFSPDGRRVATGDVDGEVRLWDVETGVELRRLLGHERQVASIAFSPDGKRLLTAGRDGTVWVWDASCGALRSLVTVEGGAIIDAHVEADKGFLATLGKDKRTRLWTLGGDLVTTIGDGQRHAEVLQFTADGERLIVAEPEKPLTVYRTEDGALIHTLLGPREWQKGSFASPNGDFLFLRYSGEWVCLDADGGSELLRLEGEAGDHCGAFSDDGSSFILGCDGGRVYLITSGTRPRVIETDGHRAGVTSVSFSPSGTYAVSTGWDGTARVWLTATGKQLNCLSLSRGGCVDTALFASDGCLISHAREKAVRLHDWTTGEEFGRLEASSDLLALALSPNRRRLATAGWNGEFQLWDIQTRTELIRCAGPWTSVFNLRFTRDGNLIVLLSGATTLFVWDYSREIAALQSSNEDCGVMVAAALELGVGDLGMREKNDFLFESVPDGLCRAIEQRFSAADMRAVRATAETMRRPRPFECYLPPSILERRLPLPEAD